MTKTNDPVGLGDRTAACADAAYGNNMRYIEVSC